MPWSTQPYVRMKGGHVYLLAMWFNGPFHQRLKLNSVWRHLGMLCYRDDVRYLIPIRGRSLPPMIG